MVLRIETSQTECDCGSICFVLQYSETTLLYSRPMFRLLIAAVCLLISVPAVAQSGRIGVAGGAATVTWDDVQKTVTISRAREGVWRSFAKIQFSENHTASATAAAGGA